MEREVRWERYVGCAFGKGRREKTERMRRVGRCGGTEAAGLGKTL